MDKQKRSLERGLQASRVPSDDVSQPEVVRVSVFKNVMTAASRAVTMDEVAWFIRYDPSVAQRTEEYRRMAGVLGKAKADSEVKQQLMAVVSVAVLFDGNGRQPANVLAFTGQAMVDLDHVDDPEAAMALIVKDPHTLMAYRTVSGQGVRVIYRYVREADDGRIDATSWPAAFLKGNEHYQRLTGCDYDRQCGDYQHLCGLAHDERLYVNPGAEPFVIADDDITAANFKPGTGRGKPRREYPTGTYTADVEKAWARVERTLQQHGLVYQPGHHHDYVMHAAFLMNRYGVDQQELTDWAHQAWADYDQRQREATIRSCYRHTDEHGTWCLERRGRKPKETSMISMPEIRQWLHDHVEVVHNVVTDMTMWRHAGDTQADWQPLDGRVLCSIRAQMSADTDKRVLKTDVHDVLSSDFSRLYHPVREYIDTLPQWDGRDRLTELSAHLRAEPVQPGQTRDEAQQLLHWALHKWLVAMVATWMKDHATNHQIFVLIGSQGIYKTTFFRHLLPPQLRPYFWENAHNSFSSKDDHLALVENCLIEIEEINMEVPRDISELKALATSEKIKERRPYDRFREERPRLASFCGSGNLQHFLCDDTGNRRWLCFYVSHIDDPHQWSLDYDQLYAQLRHDLQTGFRYWFNPGEQQRVEHQNQAFRVESDEEQLIRTRLRQPRKGEKVTLLNAAGICQLINGGTVGRGLSSKRIGIIMQRLGFEMVHKKQGNFYKIYVIPFDQIQSNLMGDNDKNDESTDSQSVEGDLPF